VIAPLADVAAESSTGEAVVFWVTAILAVAGALGMVLSRKAVHSALWMALTMINLAVMYVANSAPFLGMVQIIVYTGAVMMLFVFVIMVVGVDSSDSLIETIKGQRLAAILLTLVMGGLLVWSVGNALTDSPSVGLTAANSEFGGNVESIANLFFAKYLLVLELTAALLITAAMGAMVLAHRERWAPLLTQRDLSLRRFRDGGHPGNLPNPGVFARHNAVDTPALLPDGGTSDISVPAPVRARGDERPLDRVDIDEVRAISEGETAIVEGDDQRIPRTTSSCQPSCSASERLASSCAATPSWCSCPLSSCSTRQTSPSLPSRT